jgi:divalent metal cation (Fe/Co/Zn/Cd) transporter
VPGSALAAASLLVMPALSVAQRRTGHALGSPTAVADARQGMLCSCLSAALLAGLLLNGALGWAWADPAAALAIAAVAAKEGRDARRGTGCCAPAGPAFHGGHRESSHRESNCACCG